MASTVAADSWRHDPLLFLGRCPVMAAA